ncbi:hypothetical protein GGS24DRAFT_516147 [Hypoxylon argillaceum]|nr:hypothetical protein GGS24DRAFT_516147 [Hypoxylon argillaceum]
MASEPVPYKPDEDERTCYYYGFAGLPRLVARTSNDRWTKQQHITGWDHLCQIPKRYAPVYQEKIISNWTEDVSLAIIEALNLCSWSYFFPIRIGLQNIIFRRGSPEVPTVLLIAVEPGSLEWEEGITVALECRGILQNFQIFDVEVEICEAMYKDQGASTELEAAIDNAYPRINADIMTMLSYPGYPITHLNNQGPAPEGTVGLHLRLGDEMSVYGLTCRHVVRNNRTAEEDYRDSGNHRQFHVQGSNESFALCLERLERFQSNDRSDVHTLQTAKDRWDQWCSHDENFKHKCPSKQDSEQLSEAQEIENYTKKLIERLKAIGEKKDRIIGHLAYHPKFEVSSRQPGYLKDWALVKLDESKFINGPKNSVYKDGNYAAICTRYSPTIELFRRGPAEEEMERIPPPGLGWELHQVAKSGMKTGLTTGMVSGTRAVIRRPCSDGKTVNTQEIVIVPHKDHLKFSDGGDSGSIVFSYNGSAIALVVGSTDDEPQTWLRKDLPDDELSDEAEIYPRRERRKETDVTFATPIDWVLDDIWDFTGLEPRLV